MVNLSTVKMKYEHQVYLNSSRQRARLNTYLKCENYDGQPCHGESFAGSIGGDTHPDKTHSTRGDDLSADHSRPAEIQNI